MDAKHRNQFVAGLLAGGGSTTVLHPLDLIKVRFQVNPALINTNRQTLFTIRELFRIYRTDGPSGLYQGFSANLTASMVSWGLYFYIYENIKTSLGLDKSASSFSPAYFAASGMAGATTVAIVNPLWVVKTRMCIQTPTSMHKYGSLVDALVKIGKEEGINGLYRGLIPGLFGVSHGAVQFTIYENMKNTCRRFRIDIDNKVYMFLSTGSKCLAMAVTYPYQVIRSRAQVPALYGEGIGQIIRRTWALEGMAGFYKGLVPSTLRVLPGTALTFLIYENTLKHLNKR